MVMTAVFIDILNLASASSNLSTHRSTFDRRKKDKLNEKWDLILVWNVLVGNYSRMEKGIYHSHNPNIAIKSRPKMPFMQPRELLVSIWITITWKAY